jgi:hypothetical protein
VNTHLGVFKASVDEWKSLPDDKKLKYVQESEKLRAEFLKATAEWNEKKAKAEEPAKVNVKLKSTKGKEE